MHLLRCWFLGVALGLPFTVWGQSPPVSLLVLGGATHTSDNFDKERVKEFFLMGAVLSAERMAIALKKQAFNVHPFITWSKHSDYHKEVGWQIETHQSTHIVDVRLIVTSNPTERNRFLRLSLDYQLHELKPTSTSETGTIWYLELLHERRNQFSFLTTSPTPDFRNLPDFSGAFIQEIQPLLQLRYPHENRSPPR